MATIVSSETGESLNIGNWTDHKRYLWLLGLIVPAAPFLAFVIWKLTDVGAIWWIGPFLVYVFLPSLDNLIGKDAENPPDSAIAWLEQDKYYRWCVYLFLPLQFGSLVLASALLTGDDLGTLSKIGLTISIAMVGGIAINTAHELGHKRKNAERWLSKVALAQTGYGHFFIEHNRGHHVRVATPEDPASSRFGESFWAFLPRTVKGSFTSSLHLEKERLQRLDKPFFTIQNDVLNAWAMTVVLFGALTAVFGLELLPYLIVQAVVGFSLLEVVNYLEHYGLLRGKREDGRYERTQPSHSWNSNNVASNVLLYHLQRHSDHHANPVRRFQALRHFEEAPELPSGYATMIVLAYFPPLWRRVMDPRVLSHYEGDITKANIYPPKRAKILAKYGATERAAALAASEAVHAQDGADAYRCPGCEYTYVVAQGAPREGFPAGTAWSEVPDDWCCPDCGVREKVDFVAVDHALTTT